MAEEKKIQPEETLLDIIGGLEDNKETSETILAKFPFASELQKKTLVFADLSLADLKDAIYTAAYLGLDTDELADEFLWKLGGNEEEFVKYFVGPKNTPLKIGDVRHDTYMTVKNPEESGHAKVLYATLVKKLKGTGSWSSENLHVRFTFPDVNSCASYGNLRLFKYACEEKHALLTKQVCENAATNGHLEFLQYAREAQNCPWDYHVLRFAASEGHLNIVRYLLGEHGCPNDPCAVELAARGGHLDVLKYLHSCRHRLTGRAMDAAAFGHLECMMYLHENGCEWGEDTCLNAATVGSLECLQYAREHGCAWDFQTIRAAIDAEEDRLEYACVFGNTGKLGCLQYARAHGCPEESDM